MTLAIAGIGVAVPGEPVRQDQALGIARLFFEETPQRAKVLPALYRRTRVETRHSVLATDNEEFEEARQFYVPWRPHAERGPSTGERMERYEREAAPLARAASSAALAESGVAADEITHLVTVSCSGFQAPGVDVALIKQLGLSPRVARSNIGFMGCHGAMNGLRVARSFAESDPSAKVLLCAVELCSLHLHYGWDPEKIVANAIFSDGAAAIVGVAVGNGKGNAPSAWRLTANGSRILDDSEDAMTWTVRDHGFEMTLSPRVPDLIRQHARPWLEEWLAENELSVEAVGSWAIHPGGPRILKSFADSVGLDREALAASYEVLRRYGNMSSPTVLFLLKHLRDAGAQLPAVALGFGPGLTIEAALIQ
jgi:predicted naringenin-chalcone synthase